MKHYHNASVTVRTAVQTQIYLFIYLLTYLLSVCLSVCSTWDGTNVLGVWTWFASSQTVVDVAVRDKRRSDWLHHQLSWRYQTILAIYRVVRKNCTKFNVPSFCNRLQ